MPKIVKIKGENIEIDDNYAALFYILEEILRSLRRLGDKYAK